MLALILVEAGLRPSFIVGGELNEIGTGAAWDVGEWLVVEADESDGTFLQLAAEAAVVTSVEPDHLEHYGGVSGMVTAFDRFLAQTPGVKVASADDELAARMGRAHGAVTYGTAEDADYRIVDLQGARAGTSFTLVRDGIVAGQIRHVAVVVPVGVAVSPAGRSVAETGPGGEVVVLFVVVAGQDLRDLAGGRFGPMR